MNIIVGIDIGTSAGTGIDVVVIVGAGTVYSASISISASTSRKVVSGNRACAVARRVSVNQAFAVIGTLVN